MLRTIKVRILTGYAGILVVTLFAAVILTLNNRQASNQVNAFVSETLPALGTLDSVQNNGKTLVLIGYSLYGTTLSNEDFSQQKKALVDEIEQGITTLSGVSNDDTLASYFADFTNNINALSQTMSSSRIDWDKAREDLQLITLAAKAFDAALVDVRNDVAKAAKIRSGAITSQLQTSQNTIYLLIVVLAGVALAGFFSSKKQIAQPIEEMADKLDSLARERNLISQLPEQTTTELCRMTRSIQGLVDVFHVGMKDVKGAVSKIEHTVKVLSHSTSQSGESVSALQADIVSLVAIMDSLENDMSQNLTRSQLAAQEAKSSAHQVDSGRVQVKETAVAIADLASDIEQTANMLETLQIEGDNVSSVVKNIAEISDQTNLLALNAAIEAARAADSGRGFAVVADEIRTLAVRTHESTVKINTMLEKIVVSIASAVSTMSSNKNKAHDSVVMANELVATLEESTKNILSLVQISEEAAELANRSQIQVDEAKQGATNFQVLGDTVSENNRLLNEAAEDLSTLANGLSANVNQFKIDS